MEASVGAHNLLRFGSLCLRRMNCNLLDELNTKFRELNSRYMHKEDLHK
jgi:hypothetical protein